MACALDSDCDGRSVLRIGHPGGFSDTCKKPSVDYLSYTPAFSPFKEDGDEDEDEDGWNGRDSGEGRGLMARSLKFENGSKSWAAAAESRVGIWARYSVQLLQLQGGHHISAP